jgi:hypothetical protein
MNAIGTTDPTTKAMLDAGVACLLALALAGSSLG